MLEKQVVWEWNIHNNISLTQNSSMKKSEKKLNYIKIILTFFILIIDIILLVSQP